MVAASAALELLFVLYGIFLFLAAHFKHLRSTWGRSLICCHGSSPALVLCSCLCTWKHVQSSTPMHTHLIHCTLNINTHTHENTLKGNFTWNKWDGNHYSLVLGHKLSMTKFLYRGKLQLVMICYVTHYILGCKCKSFDREKVEVGCVMFVMSFLS